MELRGLKSTRRSNGEFLPPSRHFVTTRCWVAPTAFDAERRNGRSHAEHGNESGRAEGGSNYSLAPFYFGAGSSVQMRESGAESNRAGRNTARHERADFQLCGGFAVFISPGNSSRLLHGEGAKEQPIGRRSLIHSIAFVRVSSFFSVSFSLRPRRSLRLGFFPSCQGAQAG